jgi:transcriptional regulator with XRE-family HTH domain
MTGGTRTDPGIRRHVLGGELRRLRLASGLRLEDVVLHLGVAPSTLSRIETGRAPTRTAFLSMMLDLYGVDDADRRRELADLAREGQRRGWWADYRDLLPPGAGHYLDLETAAQQICSYSAHAVPDLVQTPDYAAAVVRATRRDLGKDGVGRLARLHARRLDLISAADAQVRLIMDESALSRLVGTAAVMAAQLRHLLTVTSDPAVTVQVAELASSQPVLCPSFAVLSFADAGDPDVACSSGPAGRVILAKPRTETSVLVAEFAVLERSAASPEESARLVEKALQRWDQR